MLNRSPVWVVRGVFPSLAQPCPSDLAALASPGSLVSPSLFPPHCAVSVLVLLPSSQVPSSYKGPRRLSISADQAALGRGLDQERQTVSSFQFVALATAPVPCYYRCVGPCTDSVPCEDCACCVSRDCPLPMDLLCGAGACLQWEGDIELPAFPGSHLAATPSMADMRSHSHGYDWNKALSEHMWREHVSFVYMPKYLRKHCSGERFILACDFIGFNPCSAGSTVGYNRGKVLTGRSQSERERRHRKRHPPCPRAPFSLTRLHLLKFPLPPNKRPYFSK